MFSATALCPLVGSVDVVVSTSPQFFCGLAGYFVSRAKRRRWILEIRDLWPESIIAVGAITNRVYARGRKPHVSEADRIVSVTDSVVRHIKERGIPAEKISVIKNGADLETFSPLPRENPFRESHGLNGKFVASYVGTHGMAHGLDTIFEAAEILKEKERIVFLLVGDGAEKENLLKRKEARGLKNVIMLPQQDKSKMPEIMAASDASLVLLKKTDLFKTVIPSKIFEAMAMERPIVLGVEGRDQGNHRSGKVRSLCRAGKRIGIDKRAAFALRRQRESGAFGSKW
jgi:glycosyltransferase involved in cell wall biosynthesis